MPRPLLYRTLTVTDCTLYHNPRCSKSRAALALLQERGVEPELVLYLQTPPTAAELKALLGKLGLTAAELVRSKEAAYRERGLGKSSSEAELLAAMAEEPKLIERPILVCGERAVIGRPPENVLELLDA